MQCLTTSHRTNRKVYVNVNWGCPFVRFVSCVCTKATNKEAMTCSWETAWRWPSKNASKGMGYDLLPDLKVFRWI